MHSMQRKNTLLPAIRDFKREKSTCEMLGGIMMKRGTCCECGDTARSELSYFCDECLNKQTLAKAVAE